MKLAKYIAMAVAVVVTATSCNNQPDDVAVTPSGTFSVEASAENTSTRTTLSSDGTLKWAKGDIMGLYVDGIQNNKAFNYTEGTGRFKGSFAYTGQSTDKVNFYAYYPYSGYSSGYRVSGAIASQQDSQFDGSSDFMIATPVEAAYSESEEMNGLNFTFDSNSHLFTILHLQLLDGEEGALAAERLSSVTVTSEGNVLSGAFEVDIRSAENPVTFTSPCDYVKVAFTNTPIISKTKPIDVWMVVNPTKEQEPINLTISLMTSTGKAEFTTTEPVELHRSTIKHLPLIKVSDKWKQSESVNGSFTDQSLLNALIAQYDTNGDKLLSYSEVAAVTDFSCESMSISSLAGLELLTNLKTFNCANNNLVEINGASIPNVTSLNIGNNSLVKLDLSACTKLKTLNANGLVAEDVNLSNSKSITEALFEGVNIGNLNLSGLSSLNTLTVKGTVGNLNLSGCKQITALEVVNIGLQSLNVSNCSSLETLDCYDNANLTTLNVKGCSSLKTIMCRSCAFTSLDLSGLSLLGTIYCQRNPLTSINLTGCVAMGNFYAHTCNWVEVDLSPCINISSANLKETPTLKKVILPQGKSASILDITNSGSPQILFK